MSPLLWLHVDVLVEMSPLALCWRGPGTQAVGLHVDVLVEMSPLALCWRGPGTQAVGLQAPPWRLQWTWAASPLAAGVGNRRGGEKPM